MKRFFALFLCVSLFGLNVPYIVPYSTAYGAAIEDAFANSTLDKNLKIKKIEQEPVIDDFAMSTLNQNLKIKRYEPVLIYDEFAKQTLNPNLKIKPVRYSTIRDEFKPSIANATQIKTPAKIFNFESLERTVIKISPLNYHTTRTNLAEGQYIDFIVKEGAANKYYNIKKDAPVKARIETISQNGAYGVPANLIIDNFIINEKITAEGAIEINGANRSLWVYPTAAVLTPFFGIGLLLLPIRGGHAKLKPQKTYQVYLDNPISESL